MAWQVIGRLVLALVLVELVAGAFLIGCHEVGSSVVESFPGTVISPAGLADGQAELAALIGSAPNRPMTGSGLAGVRGGLHVRVTSDDPQEMRVPLPQLCGGQVPLCYFVSSESVEAVTQYRLRRAAEGSNVFVSVRLSAKKREVRLAWSAVVLLSAHDVTPERTAAEPYRAATPCVQSDAEEIRKVAAELWPRSGKPRDFAAAIQQHIRHMKRAGRVRSLDALGILRSGENSICTANANLACALMRSQGGACRSVAVVLTVGQRFEMHRIVEFFEEGHWLPFDPSSLTTDLPARPWQNVVMAKTTMQEEQLAMKPRMGAVLGCPYGQEAELLTSGVMFSGPDFFWTEAKPLAEFEVSEEAARWAAKAWNGYLATGSLASGQRRATSAGTSTELIECLQMK
jgi:hypothetical protein